MRQPALIARDLPTQVLVERQAHPVAKQCPVHRGVAGGDGQRRGGESLAHGEVFEIGPVDGDAAHA